MRRKLSLITSMVLVSVMGTFAQNNVKHTGAHGKVEPRKGWSVKPYDFQVFILNNGQVDPKTLEEQPNTNKKVLYMAQMGKTSAYFTNSGVMFQYRYVEPLKKGQDPDLGPPPAMHNYFAGAEWVNSNPSAIVEPIEKQSYYRTFDAGDNKTVKTWAYKKMIYHNIYPGIDAVYTFPDGKDGFKYSLIVHPGADLSQVQLQYNGISKSKKDKDGNVIWTSKIGDITDHTPISFYDGEAGNNVAVSYQLKKVNGKTVECFLPVNGYDKSKTLVIDPWTGSPAMGSPNVAYVCDYDYAGNAYVYGGLGFDLSKFDNTGKLLWTYTATTMTSSGTYIGGLTVDRHTQSAYVSEGWNPLGNARIQKISPGGLLVGTDPGDPSMTEIWRLRWDPCTKYLFGCGCGTCCPAEACRIDTDMSKIDTANICAPTITSGGYHDFGSMDFDENDGSIYTINSLSLTPGVPFSNYLIKCPVPALVPATYQVPDGYGIQEWYSYYYLGNNCNGFSGVAASPNWLYLYQGDTIKQFNKTTGAVNAVKQVSSTPYLWGGIASDFIDNIYIGNLKNLEIYSPTFSLLSTIPMSDTVYDVKVDAKNLVIYTCGNGFLTATAIPGTIPANNPITVTTTPPSTCSACDGSISINIPDTTANTTYSWSTGATTSSVSSLCRGTYTVVVYSGVCYLGNDTLVINLPGFLLSVGVTNPSCIKGGSATVTPGGGTAPFTYSWTDGSTNQTDTAMAPGSYTVTVTDATGCTASTVVTLASPKTPIVKITAGSDSVCPGGTTTLTPSGGSTSYTWAPGSSLSCTACTSPTATVTAKTTYTVTGDSAGCKGTDSITLNTRPLPTIVVTPVVDSVCLGKSVSLTASGGASYTWTPASGLACTNCTSTLASPVTKTTYTVIGKDSHGCIDTGKATVIIKPNPKVTVTPPTDSICGGHSVSLTASATGGTSYTWSPAAGLTCTTCTNPTASPTVTTTYTVTVSNGTCSHDTTVTVKVLPKAAGTVTSPVKICTGKDTTLTATGGGTYAWSTGATTSSITVTPSSNTSYSVIVTAPDGCKDTVYTAIGIDVPNFTVCCDTGIIKGSSVLLTTSTSNVVAYIWTPGSGLSCFTCPSTSASPTSNTTYTITGTDSNGCVTYRTVTVDILCSDFFVPNVFTPNSDGKNDFFLIDVTKFDSYSIEIFDRWGTRMFKADTPNTPWTGQTSGGQDAPDGVYYYIIKATCDGNNYEHKGFVQIIR